MMYPWLDYKGLTYFSKKLREKLSTAFSDVYDELTDITDEEIEELFESDLSTTSLNAAAQNSVEALDEEFKEDSSEEILADNTSDSASD